MTKEETIELLKQTETRYIKERNKILIAYAMMHNPYNIGDIIEDHFHTIKITNISYTHAHDSLIPIQCQYTGIQLTKAMEPCKIQRETIMHQSNVKKCHTLKRRK